MHCIFKVATKDDLRDLSLVPKKCSCFFYIWKGFPSLWNPNDPKYKNMGAGALRDRSASAFPLVSASKLTLTC